MRAMQHVEAGSRQILLRYEADRARLADLLRTRGVRVDGGQDDPGAPWECRELAGEADAVAVRQPDVHEHDLGLEAARRRAACRRGRRFSNDREPAAAEGLAGEPAEGRVIVDEEH